MDRDTSLAVVLPRRIRTPWSQRAETLLKGPVQLIAWLALGAAGIALSLVDSMPGAVEGLAVAEPIPARAGPAGLVATLLVSPGDSVEAGQELAVINTAFLTHELEVARQRLAAVAAETDVLVAQQRVDAAQRDLESRRRELELQASGLRLEAAAAANVVRRADLIARLSVERRRLEVALRTAEAEQAGRRIAARRARQVARRVTRLAEDGVDRPGRAQDLGLEADELEALVETFQLTIASIGAQLDATVQRLATLQADNAGLTREPTDDSQRAAERSLEELTAIRDVAALDALERRVLRASAELAGLEARRTEFSVRAPAAGRVASLGAIAGSRVLAGETVATIQPKEAREVAIYLPEQLSAVEVPVEFRLARASAPSHAALGRVTRLADRVAPLPEPLQRDPARLVRGRAVYLSVPEGLSLVAGERVLAVPVAR